MFLDKALLSKRLKAFIDWERLKRREKVLLSALFPSLLISLLLTLVLPLSLGRLSLPVLFLVSALALFWLFPWRRSQSAGAIFSLDRKLAMRATGITASEILERGEKNAAELLVLEEAMRRLREVDPKRAFKRELPRHLWFLPPLFFFWVFLAWFPVKVVSEGDGQGGSIARRLREFSRELQKRKEFPELKRSSGLVRRLEASADQSLRAEIGEEALKRRISETLDTIGRSSGGRGGDSPSTRPVSRTDGARLSEILEEIRELKDAWKRPGSTGREGNRMKERLRRLESIPELNEEMEGAGSSSENLKEDEMERAVDQAEKIVLSELDRRALSEIRDFLGSLLDEMQEKDAAGTKEKAGRGKLSSSNSDEFGKRGSEPGNESGKTGGSSLASARLEARIPSHLRGLPGEGRSAGLKAEAGGQTAKARIPEESVMTSYARQAEEELGSESVPDGFRGMIKRYFLSLGSEGQK